jgi:hypothetical protein
MSEAGDKLNGVALDGKRRFQNGDINPDDADLVCWGYRGDDPWWVDWGLYWKMAKGHKGLIRQKRRINGVVKRGMLK